MADLLSAGSRQRLLDIARQSVEAAVHHQAPPAFDETEPELQVHAGAFVTLKSGGRLRGCLGQFRSDQPLWQLIAVMARSSATDDPRFVHDRIAPDELPELDIQISVLSPMEKIDDPLAIELGVHGIYVTGHGRSGTYLPQVATEHHMSKEQFLSSCCSGKAGLPADAWRTDEAEVYVYTAEVFGEE